MDLFMHRVRRNDGSTTWYVIDRDTGEIMSKWTNEREEVADCAVDE